MLAVVPPPVAPPSPQGGATTALISVATSARAKPGGARRIALVRTSTSWSGQPQVLLVLGSAVRDGRQWLRVLLPVRPNGRSGWVPRSHVVVRHTPYWITVAKAARTVTVYRGGRRLHRYRAVIGKAGTPTPEGLAAIYERDAQSPRNGFLGPWSLPLTILSNSLRNFGGGPGRVAIHGRDGASLADPLGSARSHGCIRIDNRGIRWIAGHVPRGTPVRIVR